MDDGKSYAFQKGQYVLNDFSFDGKDLVSRPVRVGSISKGKELSTKDVKNIGSRVERVVIVGLTAAPQGVMVKGGEKLIFSSEKLADGNYKIVIKDPKAWVGEAWTISLE